MDQLIFASLSPTHYWYEVGMLKVPAEHSDRWKSFNANDRYFDERVEFSGVFLNCAAQ